MPLFPAISCESEEYRREIAPAAYTSLLTIALGYPLVLLVIFVMGYDTMSEAVFVSTQIMRAPFKKKFYFWEVVDLLRKFVIALMLSSGSALTTGTQLAGLSIIMIAALMVQVYYRPFKHVNVNSLVVYIFSVLLFVLITAGMIFNEADSDQSRCAAPARSAPQTRSRRGGGGRGGSSFARLAHDALRSTDSLPSAGLAPVLCPAFCFGPRSLLRRVRSSSGLRTALTILTYIAVVSAVVFSLATVVIAVYIFRKTRLTGEVVQHQVRHARALPICHRERHACTQLATRVGPVARCRLTHNHPRAKTRIRLFPRSQVLITPELLDMTVEQLREAESVNVIAQCKEIIDDEDMQRSFNDAVCLLFVLSSTSKRRPQLGSARGGPVVSSFAPSSKGSSSSEDSMSVTDEDRAEAGHAHHQTSASHAPAKDANAPTKELGSEGDAPAGNPAWEQSVLDARLLHKFNSTKRITKMSKQVAKLDSTNRLQHQDEPMPSPRGKRHDPHILSPRYAGQQLNASVHDEPMPSPRGARPSHPAAGDDAMRA
jgi:hypothetical protein